MRPRGVVATVGVIGLVWLFAACSGDGVKIQAPIQIERATPTPEPTPTPAPVREDTSFKVASGAAYEVNLVPSWDNARVEGSMSSDTDINFRILSPSGAQVAKFDRVTQQSFSFLAPSKGTYKLVFDNGFSVFTSKNVRLSYTVYWR